MNGAAKAVAASLLGAAISAWAATTMRDHTRISVAETKVSAIGDDIREMKGDIKTLLRRVK